MKSVVPKKARLVPANLLRRAMDGKPKARFSTKPFSYRKNGILVHHTEHAISSADVTKALAGE